jgi:hypothetical protein
MAKLRVTKVYETREIVTRTGKLLYVVKATANIKVGENEEHVINIFAGFPVSEGNEYEFSFNDMNIRIREPRASIPGIPPIPGVPNFTKKP